MDRLKEIYFDYLKRVVGELESYTPDGGKTGHCRMENGCIVCCITDTGFNTWCMVRYRLNDAFGLTDEYSDNLIKEYCEKEIKNLVNSK